MTSKYGAPKRPASTRSMSEAFVSDGAKKPETVPFNMRIDKELRQRFRLHALMNETSMTEITEGLIRDYLAKHDKDVKK